MKFCQRCGRQFPDTAVQCPHCKVELSIQAPQQYYQQPQQVGGLRCPRCGGSNLQAVSDVHGKGVSGTKVCLFGACGLCGAGKTQTDHYWVCTSCGNRFRM